MRIATNTNLVRRNRKLAQYLFFFSFAILFAGLFVINQQAFNVETNSDLLLSGLLPSVVIAVAFIATMASVRMTNLWIREPRPENALRDNLKGMGNKSVLYNYYHIPVRHVLIVPQGVFVITTRFQDGSYTINGDRWTTHKSALSRFFSIFRFDSIGNPTQDALSNAETIQAILKPIAPDVTVQPLIVFLDPRARLDIQNPTVPVVYVSDKRDPNLKDYLRDVGKQNKSKMLTPEQIQAFEEMTLPKSS
jgi:hypothetical protein